MVQPSADPAVAGPNPYSPPKAPVVDVEDQTDPQEKPATVKWAIALLWASFGVSLLGTLFNMTQGRFAPGLPPVIMVLIFLFGQGIALWFNFKLMAGRNWARILWLILYGLGIVGSVVAYKLVVATYQADPLRLVPQTVLGLAITVLFLTPSAARWYRRERRQ